MNFRIFYASFTVLALISFTLPLVAHAQSPGGGISIHPRKDLPEDDADRLVDEFGTNGSPVDSIDLTKHEDDYVNPDYNNLSKLMWAMGALSLSDNQAIDNYLLINECELYTRFYHNDLEWEKIREAARQYISSHMSTFPTKFEVIVPIYLGRYDTEKNVFEIKDDSRMINMRRLDLGLNYRNEVCSGISGEIKGYSRNIILTLGRPFSLTRIPVSREIAELYIEEARAEYENMPAKLQMQYYERLAYLRAKIRISSFKEMIAGRQGEPQAVVFGHLDGIEIYADPEKQKLLYREDKQERTPRQRRREQKAREDAAEANKEEPQVEGIP